MRAALWVLCGAVVCSLAGAGTYVATPAWSASLAQQLPAKFVFPGIAPSIPWPASGQAALAVAGVGDFGTSGEVDASVPIASVAKIMTAYQVLTDHPLGPGEQGPTLTVQSEEAGKYGRQVAENQSVVPVAAGEALTERQALEALMLASADNMAQILARWDAGSVPEFLARANRAAARLGIRHSTYTDPSGLDAGTVSTAPDQLVLARAAMRAPAFAGIVAEKSAVIPVAGSIGNFNTLLGRDGVVGVKTGSMRAAGGCLVFAADTPAGAGGSTVRVYGVVLGQQGNPGTILPHALSAAHRLVLSAQASLRKATVAANGRPVAVVHQPLHRDRALAPAADVTVVGWPGLGFSAHVSGPVVAPVLTVSAVDEPANRVTTPLNESVAR